AECDPDRRVPDQSQDDPGQAQGGLVTSSSCFGIVGCHPTMRRVPHHRRHPMRRTVAIVVGIGLTSALTWHVASAQTAEVPAALVPAGLKAYLEVPATGVQIYTCGKNDAGAYAWIFKAPEAQLFDTQKKPIGKHYAGPTWEGLDGGKVVGAAKA